MLPNSTEVSMERRYMAHNSGSFEKRKFGKENGEGAKKRKNSKIHSSLFYH